MSRNDPLFETLRQLRASWPKRGWSWDSRFSCVASSFGLELSDEARASATGVFLETWTTKNISSAPPIVRQLAEETGGIRSDQFIFTTDSGGRLVGYGLWWPWGDDLTVSLRVGLAGYVPDADMVRLRELFGAVD